MVSAPKRTIQVARKLRQNMSLPEMLLWRVLRGRPAGLKFRKQHPVGPYVLDFYCLERRVAIEIDGIAHDMGKRPERDDARDRWLAEHRIEVVRIRATDVLADVGRVGQSIVDRLQA